MDLAERLRHQLGKRNRIGLADQESVRCAVLVPLMRDGDDYRVVYTVRTEHLPDHRGQVAFPGGKHAPSDASLAATALREAQEEVGILPYQVDVLGQLDDVHTMATRYVVTPVVGVLPPGSQFTPNPAEVAHLFTMPILALGDPERRSTQLSKWGEAEYEVEVIKAGAHNIWGLTLTITKSLLACIEQTRPQRG